MKKVTISIIVGAILIVAPMTVNAQTTSTLQAQVKNLLALVASLQQQLTQSVGGNTTTPITPPVVRPACENLTHNLYLGKKDPETRGEVSKLQKFLQKTGDYTYGEITGFYGPATENAVRSWQRTNGVVSSGAPNTTGYGMVGPSTRSKMALGCVYQPKPQPWTPVTSTPGVEQTAPVLSVNKENIKGNSIHVKFDNIDHNKKDIWIGLYKKGTENNKYIDWKYINGSQKRGGPLSKEGTVTFTIKLEIGTYEARLFYNNGYKKEAGAEFIIVKTGRVAPTLSVNKDIKQGGNLRIDFKNLSGNPQDWIGVYNQDDSGRDYKLWLYVSGTKKATANIKEGSVVFEDIQLPVGSYKAILYASNGYKALAESGIFKVIESFEDSGSIIDGQLQTNRQTNQMASALQALKSLLSGMSNMLK